MSGRALVTGGAGFIGSHIAEALLAQGWEVTVLDDLSRGRERNIPKRAGFVQADIRSPEARRALADGRYDLLNHHAAQIDVRISVEQPAHDAAINLVGFVNLLEACRHARVEHLVYASTSSVYGANVSTPFREDDPVDHPVSLYAATKRSNELMAHTYSHLFGLPTTGLRFFTVYGPWGRPDMSMALFTKAILADEPITVFNYGQKQRDFTYIDDIVEGVVRVLDVVPGSCPVDAPDAFARPSASAAPFRLYNIGNSRPVELLEYIRLLEAAIGKKATLDLQPMQPGDVVATAADTSTLEAAVGFRPATPLDQGIQRYVTWHRAYYAALPAGKVGVAGR